jgi:hypothetical protein
LSGPESPGPELSGPESPGPELSGPESPGSDSFGRGGTESTEFGCDVSDDPIPESVDDVGGESAPEAEEFAVESAEESDRGEEAT